MRDAIFRSAWALISTFVLAGSLRIFRDVRIQQVIGMGSQAGDHPLELASRRRGSGWR